MICDAECKKLDEDVWKNHRENNKEKIVLLFEKLGE